LKDKYNEVCQELTNEYPGVVVSKANFCGLLSKAWNKALSFNNITSGYKACGIYPFNPNQIPQQAYAPSSLYVVEEDGSQNTVKTGGVMQENETQAAINVGITQDAPGAENPPTAIDSVDVRLEVTAPVMMDEQDAISAERPCSPRMALRAVECAFTATQLDSYTNAYISAHDDHLKFDRLYQTQKGLKEATDTEAMVQLLDVSVKSVDSAVLETVMNTQREAETISIIAVDDIDKMLDGQDVSSQALQSIQKLPAGSETAQLEVELASTPIRSVLFPFQNASSPLDVDCDVLPYPKPQIRKRKRDGKKSNAKFFVLTSEEAYQSKLGEQAAKVQREKEKLEKQRKRKERKELRDKENIAKTKKQSSRKKSTSSASTSNSKQKRRKLAMFQVSRAVF